MVEEWKTIEGFSRYKVSPEGDVFDTKLNRLVAKQLTGIPQYYYVNVNRDDGQRKLKRVHRFVAEAYVDGRSDEFDVVDHIDRDKFNNHFSNLRWTNASGNSLNMEGNIYVFGEAVKDYSQRYESPIGAYSYLSKCLLQGMTDQEAVDKYQENLDYGLKRVVVEWDGESVYLVDLCNTFNKDYFEVNDRLKKGWNVWNALYNISPEYPFSLEVPCEVVTGHWFPSKNYLGEHFDNQGRTIQEMAITGSTYQQLQSYDHLDIHRKTVLGITGTTREICSPFNLDEGTVLSRMRRRGLTFEEALIPEKERLKYVELNGIRMTLKVMWESFELNAKTCNKRRMSDDITVEETLEYYGVDLTGFTLKY